MYANDEERPTTSLLPRTEAMDARYRSPDGDPLAWKPGDAGGPKAKTHERMAYAIQSPFTGEMHYPAPDYREDHRPRPPTPPLSVDGQTLPQEIPR